MLPRSAPSFFRFCSLTLIASFFLFFSVGCSHSVIPQNEDPSGVFTLRHEHIAVRVGPKRDQPCDIDVDLYLPSEARPDHRVPALLYSHGFGGTKAQNPLMQAELARRGYLVLAYTQIGHAGSECLIHLDDPLYEGAVVQQLIDYLGGAPGLAFADAQHTQPLPPLDYVQQDSLDHRGGVTPYDPRVGLIGNSYGGQIQFITAALDSRVDSIAPDITWNDLNEELAPNFATRTNQPSLPGVAKAGIAQSLVRLGEQQPQLQFLGEKSPYECLKYEPYACDLLYQLIHKGQIDESGHRLLRSRSIADFADKISVPVLLLQGQEDRLVPFNEALHTYNALRDHHVSVQLFWHKYGHDTTWINDQPVGDSGWNFSPAAVDQAYASNFFIQWLDFHLKDNPSPNPGEGFFFYRPWLDGSDVASEKTYSHTPSYPPGPTTIWHLDKLHSLTIPPASVSESAQQIEPITVSSRAEPVTFTSDSFRENLDVVGVGTVVIPVISHDEGTIFVSVWDIADNNARTLLTSLPSVGRFTGEGPVSIELDGFSHRFAPGHRLQLEFSGSSTEYQSIPHQSPVRFTIGDGEAHLSLPTLPPEHN